MMSCGLRFVAMLPNVAIPHKIIRNRDDGDASKLTSETHLGSTRRGG